MRVDNNLQSCRYCRRRDHYCGDVIDCDEPYHSGGGQQQQQHCIRWSLVVKDVLVVLCAT